MKLKGKRVMITGASKGLGRALAVRFAAEGADLALCARSGKALEELHNSLISTGVRVVAVQCDVASSVQVQSFVEKVAAELGDVDVLINNASRLGERTTVVDYPIGEWDDVIQTNVHGPFFLTRLIVPPMMKRGSGSIINVSSSVGRAGRKLWGAYSVSKFALEGFTQVLSEELRPFNIRVNSVNPGPMSTEMRKKAYPNEDPASLRTPDQVTDVFVYLASDDGIGISGQSLDATSFVANPGLLS